MSLEKAHRIDKGRFLQALEAVRPGLSPKPLVEHSNSFLLRNGFVEAFNDQIACRMRTQLPKEVCCIVASKSLLAYLSKIPDDVVLVKVDEESKKFKIAGKGRGGKFLTAFETQFQIDAVERPRKESWKPLSPLFGDAIGMVHECAGKDESKSVLTCVHVHPKFVEASDNTQWCRFRVKTRIEAPFLVKKDAVRHIVKLDMTEFAETESWVHFRNPAGLVFSCRRVVQEYPDVGHLLELQTPRKMTLPKELAQAAETVNIPASEDKDANAIMVELEPGGMRLSAVGVTLEAYEKKTCNYKGKPVAFMIQPAMLVEITKRASECGISDGFLTMAGDRWTYVSELAPPAVVKKEAAKKVKTPEEGEE